jgi:hypothetical protein
MSTYEGEHTIFGLLCQANLTQNDVLQLFEEFLVSSHLLRAPSPEQHSERRKQTSVTTTTTTTKTQIRSRNTAKVN